jgi:TIR domain-containing protein
MSFDVFISYSTKDATAAKAACAALEAAKIRCWMAPRDIVAGARWGASIVRAINECRVMVLIFSSNANASEQVHREVDRAFSKGRAVVPLRIEDVRPADELAYYLDTVHWLDALTPPLERNLEKLVATVQALLPTMESAPPSSEPLTDDLQAAQAQDEARAEDEQRLKEAEALQSAEAPQREKEVEEAARARQKQEAEAQSGAEERRKFGEAQAKERAEQESAFAKAKCVDTVEALDGFIAANPTSHLIAESKALRAMLAGRDDAYKAAMMSDNAAALKTFADRYPQAEEADEVQQSLRRFDQPRGSRLSPRTVAMAFGVLSFVIIAGGSAYLARNRTNNNPVEMPQTSEPVVTSYVDGCFLVPIAHPKQKDTMAVVFDKPSQRFAQIAINKGKQDQHTVILHELLDSETGDMGWLVNYFITARDLDGAGSVVICSQFPQDRVVSALKSDNLI